jgi:hypothetical protein
MQGNVILTDANYEVLTLLRSHRDDAKGLAIMARHPYPIHTVRRRGPLARPLVEEALGKADDKSTLRGAGLGGVKGKDSAGKGDGHSLSGNPL